VHRHCGAASLRNHGEKIDSGAETGDDAARLSSDASVDAIVAADCAASTHRSSDFRGASRICCHGSKSVAHALVFKV
jgi:hypothetical protein